VTGVNDGNSSNASNDGQHKCESVVKRFLSERTTGYAVGSFCLAMTLIGAIAYQLVQFRYSIVFYASAFGAQNVFTGNSRQLGMTTTVMTTSVQKMGVLGAAHISSGMSCRGGTENTHSGDNEKKKKKQVDDVRKFLPLVGASCTLLGAVVGGLLTRLGSRSFEITKFVVSLLQFGAFILHDEMLVIRPRRR